MWLSDAAVRRDVAGAFLPLAAVSIAALAIWVEDGPGGGERGVVGC
jgi:hypothetical protein